MTGRKKQKVFVGLSGGVDSSVAAAVLKRQGYDVTGVFIKVWQPEFFECTWRQDRLDAMRVAARLDIPFLTLDLEQEYKRDVVDYMIREYAAGRTPNPDVMCNKYVKFGGFLDFAMRQGADFIATGHYARVKKVESQKSKVKRHKNSDSRSGFQLLAGRDGNKDQSYFLWTLTQSQLAKTLVPIGDLEKPAVRKLAETFGLATAEKKDSQGLCFIGKVDMREFLQKYIPAKQGAVLDERGRTIGGHDGAFALTIGQRHGFRIDRKTADDAPYYIVAKDVGQNTITVSHTPKLERDASRIVQLENANWIAGEPDTSKEYAARIRYRAPLEACRIVKNKKSKVGSGGWELHFKKPQKAVASGQSAVVYDGDICLGGGIIA